MIIIFFNYYIIDIEVLTKKTKLTINGHKKENLANISLCRIDVVFNN